ncbi:MAG: DegV family EDD domain-containing protein, partial [Eubacterium sp.]|nr:DegV family EDD domain-containing protein [Eubacterium sp.]
LAVSLVMFFAYIWYPELTIVHDEQTAWADAVSSFYIVSILIAVMIAFQVFLYRRENMLAREQKDEIDELNRAQNRFFSSMSHEIRTPINTIIGLNEMILRENASPEINEDAENIESAGKMLLHLVNDILDMSKFQSGQMRLNETAFYIADMLREVADMIYVRAKEAGLELIVDVSPMLPEEIIGDEMRIKQILVNILNNAVKYTREGTVTLTVSAEEKEDRDVNIVYTVSDTGIGIKKESIPFLFDAFRRADEERTAMIEGTGLGLSIVKQFVDLMGGRVTVNSVYTKGSTFIVELPTKRVGDKYVGEMSLNRRRSGRKEYNASFIAPSAHVLVVDDTPANLRVVRRLLRDTQIDLTCVESGAEALEKTMEKAYHVIFMDHLMPDMDGIECMHRIRSQLGGLNRESRIVALTANAGSDNAALYSREGFDGYLVKPVTGVMLENELRRFLPPALMTITDESEDIEEMSKLWRDVHEIKAMVAISAASVADLPRDIQERYGISVIPCMIETEDGLFRDGVDITTDGLLRYMEDEEKKVAVISTDSDDYLSFFAERLKEARNLIYFSVSGRVQENAYPSALEAAKAFDNVMIIDCGHISCSMGILAIEAAKMAENGATPAQIVENIEIVKTKIDGSIILENMDFLVRGGQVSKSLCNIMKSLLLRPVVKLKHGSASVFSFRFGSRRKAWRRYIRHTLRNRSTIDPIICLIPYAGLGVEDLEWIKNEIERLFEFREIRFVQTSPAMALNCGPNSFGMMFKRK